MSITENTSTIDWSAAELVAERLGLHTRNLVASRDPEAVREWALRMASAHEAPLLGFMGPRMTSYAELAVLVSESSPEDVAADTVSEAVPAEVPGNDR